MMGDVIRAMCKCGFKSEDIYAGGGMEDFQTNCTTPALCTHCSRFLIKNYLKKYSKCPVCRKKVVFYNDPSLQSRRGRTSEGNGDVFSWDTRGEKGLFRLPDNHYLCPRCGKMTLRFICIGLWD